MTFEAVVFDLDGTLLDTLEDIADSMNAVLERQGFSPHPVDKYRRFVGDGMETLARRVLGAASGDASGDASSDASSDAVLVRKTVDLMRDEYGRNWARKTRPYEGIPETMARLDGMGVIMNVFSNKPDEFTVSMVSRYFPEIRFACVMGAGIFPRKPDPAGALHIASRLKIDPSRFLYLGDTDTDMRTATAAGMFPVGVLWGFRDAPELTSNGAKLLIEKPGELIELLRR